MYNPYSLDGKTILITGAASGIGKATSIECSKVGAKVVAVDLNAEGLNALMPQLEGEGHISFAGNLCAEGFLKELSEQVPPLDGVFLCAGVSDTTPVKFITEEKIDRVMSVNLVAPIMMLKQLLIMKKINKGGSLVWMSSYGAEKVEPGLGIYAASKSAVNGIMRAYAKELIARKIRSNSIMPMMIRTELLSTLNNISDKNWEKQEAMYPLGFGSPLDVAYAAIYLFSDASRWITGTQIKMDGGSNL
ncbi:MAG: SDR family oxidoreductase [Paludibacteraceae bacterium]|nr:SDR family oxidoreductase [Paludibacteraceae bacterium]